jgi:hypothetical protein
MDGTDARELLSAAVERIETTIARAEATLPSPTQWLIVDVRLWPAPLIKAVVAVLRRRGRRIRCGTRTDESGYSGPALEIHIDAQREFCFG